MPVGTAPASPPRRQTRQGGPPGPGARAGLAGPLARWTSLAEDEILGLCHVVAPGALCVDVGANYGLYTHALSWLVGRAGRVYGIEPLPGPFRALTTSASLLGAGNVRPRRVALGARTAPGLLSVPVRRGLPVHGRAFLTTGTSDDGPNVEFAAARSVPVDVVTLDEWCTREAVPHVDFVKVDVEGAEFAVLAGGTATLSAHRPTLLLEIEERHTRKYGHGASDVVGWLADRGYRMHRWADGGWRPTREPCADSRNYLFVHASRADAPDGVPGRPGRAVDPRRG